MTLLSPDLSKPLYLEIFDRLKVYAKCSLESDALAEEAVQEALEATDRDFDLVPTWIPDGFELNDITINENPIQKVYNAQYTNSDKVLTFTVRSYLESDLEVIEITDTLLEIYEVAGIEYHIFSNNQQLRAVWKKNSYECYISGELTVDTMKAMINSIGKG